MDLFHSERRESSTPSVSTLCFTQAYPTRGRQTGTTQPSFDSPQKPASFPVENHQSDNTQDKHRLVPLTRCNQSSHIQIWLSTRQGCMVRSTGTQEPKEEFLYIRHIVLFSMDSSSSSTNSKSQCRSPSHYIKISTIFTVFPLLFFPTQVFVDRLTIDEI